MATTTKRRPRRPTASPPDEEVDRPTGGIEGAPVDWRGATAYDPTENVKDLSEASAQRQDDLRAAAAALAEVKYNSLVTFVIQGQAHAKEMAELREKYQEKLAEKYETHQEKVRAAESNRLDSIRQVDREEVAKTAASANVAIATLAKQTSDIASTLQKQVTELASATEVRTSASTAELTKRISALELSSSEGKGRAVVADPAFDKLTALVERLATKSSEGSGEKQGISTSVAFALAVLGVIGTLAGIVGVGFAVLVK